MWLAAITCVLCALNYLVEELRPKIMIGNSSRQNMMSAIAAAGLLLLGSLTFTHIDFKLASIVVFGLLIPASLVNAVIHRPNKHTNADVYLRNNP